MATDAQNKNITPVLNTPEQTQPSPVQVVGSLGIATELLERNGNLQPYKTWMGITTSEKTYPNEKVLAFAKWASENSGGFTLVVSNILQKFNWVAQSERGWQAWHEGRYPEGLARAARKRVDQFRELFAEQGLDAKVIYWTDISEGFADLLRTHGFEITLANEAETAKDYERITGLRSQDTAELDSDFRKLVRKMAQPLIVKAMASGKTREEAEFILSLYAEEEVAMSLNLAHMHEGTIKIGPPQERYYDEITLREMSGSGVHTFGPVYREIRGKNKPAFGAVYLELNDHER